jgi:uncharacterized protein
MRLTTLFQYFAGFYPIIVPLTMLVAIGCLLLAAPDDEASEPERIEVLFLGSENRSNHDPPTRFRVLRKALGPKAINITYAHTVDALTAENLAQFDVLLIFANLYTIDKETQGKALLDFARNGGGCVLLHCAAGCFRDSQFDGYVDLLGAQFKSHTTGVFRAQIVNEEHPVMKGWPGFECWDETYEHKRHGKDRLILQKRDEEPWTWVKTYGKGRVFYTASGHDHRCWNLTEYQDLVHRAIRWTAHDDSTRWLAPEDLPELRYRLAAAPKDPENPVGPLNQIQQPLSPNESLKLAQVPPGFEIRLFAAEPMVVNPIAINWDDRGRLWVVEAFDYPHKIGTEQPQDRIKILEDTDGDGRADKVKVFAEGLNIATTVLPVEGGAIATDGDSMVLLRDTNGDDRADSREVLWSGIGLRDTHACVSNLRHGFDGWIYASVGYSGLDVTVAGKRYQSSQGVFRFLPDGSAFEVLQNTSNNTWGLGFTEQGDLVGSTANGNPSWYHSIPNRYFEMVGRKGQQVARADRKEKLAPITSDYFQNNPKEEHSSGAGHAVYTSRRFPQYWWNQRVLICETPMHLVAAPRIERRGDRFITTGFEHNLYASADAWSAPVAAEVGPDGAVWMADWYNPICNHNPYRGHFEKGPGNALKSDDRDREHGRIYRLYPIGTKDDAYPDLDNEEGAVKALSHDNLFWRLAGQRRLAYLLDEEAILKRRGATSDLRARFHLTLAASNQKLDAVQVAALTRRPDGERSPIERLLELDWDLLDRKAAALSLVEMKPDPTLGETLLALIDNEPGLEGHKHLADAIRLAVLRHPEGFLRVLLENKREAKRPYLREIVKHALERVGRDSKVLSGGLRALAKSTDSELGRQLVTTAAEEVSIETIKSLSENATRGREVYISCVACHQPDGKGLAGVFPPLAGSQRLLGTPDLPIKIVLKGLQGPLTAGVRDYDSVMPGHERLLTDQEIADVLSYVRSAWENGGRDISTEQVRVVRERFATRQGPWTISELEKP